MPAWRTISLWMDQLDEPLLARPALEQDLDVDVAIIGAGYTGLWTAYYLKRLAPELNIAIVEAQTAGFGASGRNGGWLMGNVLGEDRLLADLPPEQRRASFDLLHGIPDEVGIVLEREDIDCDYRKGGALYCAARYPEQEASLRHYLDTLYSQGLTESDYRWLSPEQLAQQIRIAKPYGGIYAPHVATIHPAKLVRGLARVVEKMGVKIYENSPATQWQSGGLRTAKASVRSRWIVPAVEGYSVSLPP
ncbi:MAG: NAD(P)/FAD-dependent oxidoreductase, partial [Pseudomonas fluorescens]